MDAALAQAGLGSHSKQRRFVVLSTDVIISKEDPPDAMSLSSMTMMKDRIVTKYKFAIIRVNDRKEVHFQVRHLVSPNSCSSP